MKTEKHNPEDKRVRRTKTLLKKALTELILEKGFENVRVQDVIDRADVGRTSFYTYFKSKEDLLLQNLDDLEGMFDSSETQSDRTSATEDFSLHMFRHLKENWRLARVLLGNRKMPVVRNHVQGIIVKYYKNRYERDWGKSRSLVEIEAAAVFSAGALISLTLWWLTLKRPPAPEKIQEMFVAYNATFTLPGKNR